MLAELPAGVLTVIAIELDIMLTGTCLLKLIGIRLDPNVLISEAMLELRRAGILVEVLGYWLY